MNELIKIKRTFAKILAIIHAQTKKMNQKKASETDINTGIDINKNNSENQNS